MLTAAGYQCYSIGESLGQYLRSIGCGTVVSIKVARRREGGDAPMSLPVANAKEELDAADLYVDVKAQRNAEKVWEKHPNLKGKVLWYRINAGEPEHAVREGVDLGDEINPPCPILTPNLWYRRQGPWSNKAYVCWLPFYRFNEYAPRGQTYSNPICLNQNIVGYNMGDWVEGAARLGIQIFGYKSPGGLISHSLVPQLLASTLAMVHLKQADAPGYALYEALAAACPILISQRFLYRTLSQEMFEEGVTCLVFDRVDESLVHTQYTKGQIADGLNEIASHLQRLKNPDTNRRFGEAGRNRLKHLMWNEERDGDSFRTWMGRMFSGNS
jgi:hypothetical protein